MSMGETLSVYPPAKMLMGDRSPSRLAMKEERGETEERLVIAFVRKRGTEVLPQIQRGGGISTPPLPHPHGKESRRRSVLRWVGCQLLFVSFLNRHPPQRYCRAFAFRACAPGGGRSRWFR